MEKLKLKLTAEEVIQACENYVIERDMFCVGPVISYNIGDIDIIERAVAVRNKIYRNNAMQIHDLLFHQPLMNMKKDNERLTVKELLLD